MVIRFYYIIICFLLFGACAEPTKQAIQKYIFLGHTYQWGTKNNDKIDQRLEDFDYSIYDQIWLGGDLCARTGERKETLTYLDSIFDLSAETTHWTLGNHDVGYGPLEWIEEATQRKTFYTKFINGINLVVLNTNEFHHPNYTPKPLECKLLEEQLDLLEVLADTVKEASHVVVMHHYAFLTNEMTDYKLDINKIFNLYKKDLRVDCAGMETFESKIYPILEKIQQKDIQVVMVSGDLGQRSKAFEYQTKEGIWFLGSGINNSAIDHYIPDYVTDTSPDKILIFEHDVEARKLKWYFEVL